MDFTLDYASLVKKLEVQELESPSGIASPQVYGQLLAIYLLFNDLPSAKFLWKRIPDEIKSSNEELKIIWQVGKCLWTMKYSEVCSIIDVCNSWPNHLKNIMKLLSEQTRTRVLNLIANAYSKVTISDAAKLSGYQISEILPIVESLGWTVDHQSKILIPQKPKAINNSSSLVGPDKGTELLKKLTDYVVFLESVQ